MTAYHSTVSVRLHAKQLNIEMFSVAQQWFRAVNTNMHTNQPLWGTLRFRDCVKGYSGTMFLGQLDAVVSL